MTMMLTMIRYPPTSEMSRMIRNGYVVIHASNGYMMFIYIEPYLV